MKILLLGNNWLAWKVAELLVEENEEIVGLVLHAANRRKYGSEIVSAIHLKDEFIFQEIELDHSRFRDAIEQTKPQIALSVLFGKILKPDFLKSFPRGCINVHPSYLPYNKGAYPNVWSIMENTPAGVSIHYIDKGIDTGDIIAQSKVEVLPYDTGESLYRKLELAAFELFKQTWPIIRKGGIIVRPQTRGEGTCHRVKDVENIDCIDLDKTYRAGDLINILRARTFGSYPGAYFIHKGRKIYLRLELIPERKQDATDVE